MIAERRERERKREINANRKKKREARSQQFDRFLTPRLLTFYRSITIQIM